MEFHKFEREHFDEYQSWFDQDKGLTRFLAYPDDVWLEYLNSPNVQAFAVIEDEQMLAEVQIDRDPDGEGYLAIAVAPHKRRLGFASRIVQHLIEAGYVEDLDRLVAFARQDHLASQKFLVSAGFTFNGAIDDDGFKEYVYSFVNS